MDSLFPAVVAASDKLEATLPHLIADHPEDGNFWLAFGGEADAITENAENAKAEDSPRCEAGLIVHSKTWT